MTTTAKLFKTLIHFRGCLLGGAIGDALGAPVEFLTLEQIRSSTGRTASGTSTSPTGGAARSPTTRR